MLLQEVARRLRACVRKSDTVGRIGGDEFVIVLPGVRDEHDTLALAEKVRECMSPPLELSDNRQVTISPSIGVAIYPDHGSTDTELFRNADNAMYQAKAKGRNAVQLFHPETRDH
jgi:diguanylate cyclase (GGDEF)-like protein